MLIIYGHINFETCINKQNVKQPEPYYKLFLHLSVLPKSIRKIEISSPLVYEKRKNLSRFGSFCNTLMGFVMKRPLQPLICVGISLSKFALCEEASTE